jgi:hypothetical protein
MARIPRFPKADPFTIDNPQALLNANPAAKALEEWVQPNKKPTRKSWGTPPAERRRVRDEVAQMMGTGDWDAVRPAHFVALYEHLHAIVYGVEPSELDNAKVYSMATQEAARALADRFAGDTAEMVEFIRWSWKREEGREKWRRENKREGGRVGWRLQFGGAFITDYRLDKARRWNE